MKRIILTESQYQTLVRHIHENHSQMYRNAVKDINDAIYDGTEKNEKGIVTSFGFPATKQINSDGKEYYEKVPNSRHSFTYADGTSTMPSSRTDDNFRTIDVDLEAKVTKNGKAVNDKSIFAVGNTKIGRDTVILNLTSALQCPSMDVCKVAAACYARNEETIYHATLNRNLRNQNMVKLLQKKGKLDLLFTALKWFIIDCEQEGNIINYVRINEAGDFPNPQIIATLDEWAAELENGVIMDLPGFQGNVNHPITVAAYTAQGKPSFFNAFENVKHMVVNASLPNIHVGDNSYVKRYFYALSAKDYNKLPDTDIKLINGVRTPIVKECNNTDIVKKGFYYKCPCNITDIYGMKRQCPSCQICYNKQPAIVVDEKGNQIGKTRKYYVVVKAHGSKKKMIDTNADKINSLRQNMENNNDETTES